ncbi:MAG: hypothetical protein VB099_06770 [Candidatus Limiplasma sp.]|nr:hypothetical protein [Candidatus Limiplasma sp.]
MENIKRNIEQENQQTASAKMGNKNVLNGLKVRTITAKLRDAVIISLNEDIGEIARFKNIELPEALRDLPVEDYQFTKTIDGKLEFELYFRPGILPKEMPEPRPKVTREEKAAAKKAMEEEKAEAPEKQAPAAAEAKKPEAATTEPMDKKAQTPQAAMDTMKPMKPVSKEKMPVSAVPATALMSSSEPEAKKPQSPGRETLKIKPKDEPTTFSPTPPTATVTKITAIEAKASPMAPTGDKPIKE